MTLYLQMDSWYPLSIENVPAAFLPNVPIPPLNSDPSSDQGN